MSNKPRRNQNVNYLSKIKIDQVCISGKLWKNFTFAGEKGDFLNLFTTTCSKHTENARKDNFLGNEWKRLRYQIRDAELYRYRYREESKS